jgi:hypothetical protein
MEDLGQGGDIGTRRATSRGVTRRGAIRRGAIRRGTFEKNFFLFKLKNENTELSGIKSISFCYRSWYGNF